MLVFKIISSDDTAEASYILHEAHSESFKLDFALKMEWLAPD